MSDEFYQALCDRPWDVAPRLAYADWLAANGQSRFADFIREQCQHPENSVSSFQLGQGRGEHDFDPVESGWYKQLPRPRGVMWSSSFKGGFLHGVAFSSPRSFSEHAATMFAASPIDSLGIERLTDQTTGEIVSSSYLQRLEDLALIGISDLGVRLLAACPYLVRLKTLHLDGIRLRKDGHPARARLGDDGAVALADSLFLGRLENLYLENHAIGDRGALALAESPRLAKVNFLCLGDTGRLSEPVLEKIKKRFEWLDGWPTQGDPS